MKNLILSLLFALFSSAQPYLCAVRSKMGGRVVAPNLSDSRVKLDGVLTNYHELNMIANNPMTVFQLDTLKLDYKKMYALDFRAQTGALTNFFRIRFTKATGLVVHLDSDMNATAFRYEYTESTPNPPALSFQQKNGWVHQISCEAL